MARGRRGGGRRGGRRHGGVHHHRTGRGRRSKPYMGEIMEQERQNSLISSGRSLQGLFGTNYLFNSTDTALIARVDTLTSEEVQQMKSANLTINGRIIEKFDSCCYTTTCILGALFVFPLCLFCCDCYKKKICPLYQVHVKAYEAISQLIQATQLEQLTVTVSDNSLNASKFGILMNALSYCSLKSFTLTNRVIDIPLYENQYENLQQNASQIKALGQQRGINIVIRWNEKVV